MQEKYLPEYHILYQIRMVILCWTFCLEGIFQLNMYFIIATALMINLNVRVLFLHDSPKEKEWKAPNFRQSPVLGQERATPSPDIGGFYFNVTRNTRYWWVYIQLK